MQAASGLCMRARLILYACAWNLHELKGARPEWPAFSERAMPPRLIDLITLAGVVVAAIRHAAAL